MKGSAFVGSQFWGSCLFMGSAWYRTYTSWDQVEAPRFPTILSYTQIASLKLHCG
jgi:hypothetical protein